MANMTTTTGDKFIPEVWLNEVRAYLKAKLVAANLVKNVNFVGRPGDVLHIPDVSALSANNKSASTDVTFQAPTETEFTLTINKHKEASFLIEDILKVQSAYPLRQEYTRSAGYAIAKQIDTDLLALYSGLSTKVIGGDGVTAWSASANTNTGNGSDLTDAGLRRVIETLDSADVPMEDRVLIIHPSQKNVLLGIARFTEYQTYGSGAPIRSGEFGEIYGVKVYVTTQIPEIAAADTTTLYKVNLLMHKDAFMLATQLAPRLQAGYLIEKLATAVVVDTVYGVAEFRDNHAVAIYTPK